MGKQMTEMARCRTSSDGAARPPAPPTTTRPTAPSHSLGDTRVTARDLNGEPGATLDRVRTAMVERGATGLRRHFKTEWQRYFAA